MPRDPAVRASAVRDALAVVRKVRPGRAEEVLQRIPAESLRVIETTPRLGFIPVEHDHWVPDSVVAVFGEAEGSAVFRAMLPTFLDTALLKTLTSATNRLFGLNPGSLAWAALKGWHLMYRDFCELEIPARTHGACDLLLSDLAPAVLRYPGYEVSMREFLGSFGEVTGVEAHYEFELDRSRREAIARWRWDSP